MSDVETPPLWSDAVAYAFMDDAQKQFCRFTRGIEDARSFRLTVAISKEWYSVDERILHIRSALTARGIPVPMVPLERMGEQGLRFDGTLGPIKALIPGLEKRALRAVPVPSVAEALSLQTYRLPETISATGEGDFEIDEHHHQHLQLWMKHRAYGVQDSEVYDKRKEVEFEARFKTYCDGVKIEQSRLNKPVGTVAYGGI
jgi:hypothetical protein